MSSKNSDATFLINKSQSEYKVIAHYTTNGIISIVLVVYGMDRPSMLPAPYVG